jgi:hypothetical protein
MYEWTSAFYKKNIDVVFYSMLALQAVCTVWIIYVVNCLVQVCCVVYFMKKKSSATAVYARSFCLLWFSVCLFVLFLLKLYYVQLWWTNDADHVGK